MSFSVAKKRRLTCILLDLSTDATLAMSHETGSHVLLIGCLALCACTAARLSHDEARKKIAEIGRSQLVPDAIEIRRIVSQTRTKRLPKPPITLAFQFKRDNPNADWQIEAVRLGDRDWISLDELLAAINEGRRRTTVAVHAELADGVEKYRADEWSSSRMPETSSR